MNRYALSSQLFLAFLISVLIAFPAFAQDSQSADTQSGDATLIAPIPPPPVQPDTLFPKPPLLQRPIACPLNYFPVCGENGKTYGNACMAQADGIKNFKNGPCAGSSEENLLRPRPVPPPQPFIQIAPKPGPGNGGGISSGTPPQRPGTLNRPEEMMKQHVKRYVALLLASIDRLEKLILRIESRASKLEASGIDISEVEIELDAARSELDAARGDLETIVAYSGSILQARNLALANEALNPAKAALESARRHIRSAEQHVRSALSNLRRLAEPTIAIPQQKTKSE